MRIVNANSASSVDKLAESLVEQRCIIRVNAIDVRGGDDPPTFHTGRLHFAYKAIARFGVEPLCRAQNVNEARAHFGLHIVKTRNCCACALVVWIQVLQTVDEI